MQWCQNIHDWLAEKVGVGFGWEAPQRGLVPGMVRATHTAPQAVGGEATRREGRKLRGKLGKLRRLLHLPHRPLRAAQIEERQRLIQLLGVGNCCWEELHKLQERWDAQLRELETKQQKQRRESWGNMFETASRDPQKISIGSNARG